MKKYRKRAFSLAEMMIVLLVMSIILAATMPIITKRTKSSVDKIWAPTQNNSDAYLYFGSGKNQGVIIGDTKFPNDAHGDPIKGKLLLKSTSDSIPHILFSTSTGVVGKIRLAENQIEFGSSATANGDNSTAIGQNTIAKEGATSIGDGAQASSNSTAIGKSANANDTSSSYSIAIGNGTASNNTASIAIGTAALGGGSSATTASGENSIAIGSGAVANNSNSIALGYKSKAAENSIAIGANASTNNYANSIAIGTGVENTTEKQLNIGTTLYTNSTGGITTINLGASGITLSLGGTVILSSGEAVTSDIRKKNIIGEYKSGLQDLLKIKTYEFTYKNDKSKNKKVGVIAQEIQKIYPNAVVKDSEGFFAVRKEDMFYAVINAIKELNSNFLSLKKENEQLKNQVEELTKRIEILENTKK